MVTPSPKRGFDVLSPVSPVGGTSTKSTRTGISLELKFIRSASDGAECIDSCISEDEFVSLFDSHVYLPSGDDLAWFEVTKTFFLNNCQGVEIRPSELSGNGVFVKQGKVLPKDVWVTSYPGRKRLEDPSDVSLQYGLTVGKYVWDATGFDYRFGFGHVINSCHPDLPAPYNVPNAKYIVVRVINEESGRSCLRGGIITCAVVHGGEELLTDYHWLLKGVGCHLNVCGKRISYHLFHDCDMCRNQVNI